MIGLIGAMNVEVEALEARLENPVRETIGMDTFVRGTLFGQEAVLAVCGPGKINAALCAQSMILRYHPAWLLNLGVAGSMAADVRIGDMVIANAAVQHDYDTSPLDPPGLISKINLTTLPCDAGLRERLKKAAEAVGGFHVHVGLVATGDQFIHQHPNLPFRIVVARLARRFHEPTMFAFLVRHPLVLPFRTDHPVRALLGVEVVPDPPHRREHGHFVP